MTVVVDSVSGKLALAPTIHARGFVEDDAVFDAVLPEIEAALEQAMASGGADPYQLQQVVRHTLGHWVSVTFRRRPMIIPVVLEV